MQEKVVDFFIHHFSVAYLCEIFYGYVEVDVGFGVFVGPSTVMVAVNVAPNICPAPSLSRQFCVYVPFDLGACRVTVNCVHLPGSIFLFSLTDSSPNLSPPAGTRR